MPRRGEDRDLWLPCSQVDEEVRRRRLSREYDLYDGKVAEAETSCAKAAVLVATLRSLDGPMVLDDGAVVPAWADAQMPGIERAPREYPVMRDEHVALHAKTLLKCGDGASLGTLLDRSNEELAGHLARAFPRASHAMSDAGTAPPRLRAALEHVPRPQACPSSPSDVLALLRARPVADRIAGCECTNAIAASPERAEADRERQRLITSDEATQTTTSGSSATAVDLANAPPGAGLVLLLPLVLGSLSKGRTETWYPVREACKESLPVASP